MKTSIPDIFKQIKSGSKSRHGTGNVVQRTREFLDDKRWDIFVVVIIILVSVGSFSLGRLSAVQKEDIVIEQHMQVKTQSNSLSTLPVPPLTSMDTSAGIVVASKTGSKYHFPWCAGARTIKEENKVWFNSVEAARAAGLSPAGNCKGLK